jgi:hypothetical protein
MKPEKKPEVVVVAPPTAPTKAPKETTQAPSSPPPLFGGRDENQVPVEPMTTPVPGPMDPSQGSGGSLDGNRGHNDVQILDHKPDERHPSFFAQPGILAGKFIIKYSQGGSFVSFMSHFVVVVVLLLFPWEEEQNRVGCSKRVSRVISGQLLPPFASSIIEGFPRRFLSFFSSFDSPCEKEKT